MQRFYRQGLLAGTPITRGVLLAVAFAGLLATAEAFSAGELSAGERAQQLIASLEARQGQAKVAREPLERAKTILGRAHEARADQREAQARLLEDFALEWALTGVDLLAVHGLEQQAAKLEHQQTEAETRLRRARALLEETETRRGRAVTELKRLDPSAEEPKPAQPATPSVPGPTEPPSEGQR